MFFSDGHLELVKESLDIAERFTSRFYCIPGREWSRYRYDVVTLAEAPSVRPGNGGLASLEKLVYERFEERRSHKESKEFYRILLDDIRILNALGPEAENRHRFSDLLCYILTHELIHIVRFTNEMHAFEAPLEERALEEKRVHRLTWDVLRPLSSKGIRDIHAHYVEAPMDELRSVGISSGSRPTRPDRP